MPSNLTPLIGGLDVVVVEVLNVLAFVNSMLPWASNHELGTECTLASIAFFHDYQVLCVLFHGSLNDGFQEVEGSTVSLAIELLCNVLGHAEVWHALNAHTAKHTPRAARQGP